MIISDFKVLINFILWLIKCSVSVPNRRFVVFLIINVSQNMLTKIIYNLTEVNISLNRYRYSYSKKYYIYPFTFLFTKFKFKL